MKQKKNTYTISSIYNNYSNDTITHFELHFFVITIFIETSPTIMQTPS